LGYYNYINFTQECKGGVCRDLKKKISIKFLDRSIDVCYNVFRQRKTEEEGSGEEADLWKSNLRT